MWKSRWCFGRLNISQVGLVVYPHEIAHRRPQCQTMFSCVMPGFTGMVWHGVVNIFLVISVWAPWPQAFRSESLCCRLLDLNSLVELKSCMVISATNTQTWLVCNSPARKQKNLLFVCSRKLNYLGCLQATYTLFNEDSCLKNFVIISLLTIRAKIYLHNINFFRPRNWRFAHLSR